MMRETVRKKRPSSLKIQRIPRRRMLGLATIIMKGMEIRANKNSNLGRYPTVSRNFPFHPALTRVI